MMLRLLGGNFTKARSHLFVTSSFSMLGHSSIHGPASALHRMNAPEGDNLLVRRSVAT